MLGGGKVKINTHVSCSGGTTAYNAGVDNWLFVFTDGLPYVNSTYWNGTALVEGETGREAAQFTLAMGDLGYLMSVDATTALAFDVNWRCAMLNPTANAINRSKSEWIFVPAADYESLAAGRHFSVASLNVDGLPPKLLSIDINPTGPQAYYSRYIGQRIKAARYDVVGLSEDFNYHKHLYGVASGETDRISPNDGENALQFSYTSATWRGPLNAASLANAMTSGFQIDSDGLGLLTRNASSTTASGETFTEWGTKHGNMADGFDENLKKGFRYYLVTLTDGTTVDLYILHMDAEVGTADIAARESQLQQLTQVILASNNRRPIIVMGDTNCRYTRDRIRSLFINPINDDPRFTIQDPWVEWAYEGDFQHESLNYHADGSGALMVYDLGYTKGEVVDKVFYINNRDSKFLLTPLTLTNDMTFCRDVAKAADDDSGAQAADETAGLADHWPVAVTFDIRVNHDPLELQTEGGLKTYIRAYGRDPANERCYVKGGGKWTTGALLGKYGIPMTVTYDSEHDAYLFDTGRQAGLAQGQVGHAYLKADGTDLYLDGANDASARWHISIVDNEYYMLVNEATGKAMKRGALHIKSGPNNNIPTVSHNVGPNTYLLTTATPDITDSEQWFALPTTDDLRLLAFAASEEEPYNITYRFTNKNWNRYDHYRQEFSTTGLVNPTWVYDDTNSYDSWIMTSGNYNAHTTYHPIDNNDKIGERSNSWTCPSPNVTGSYDDNIFYKIYTPATTTLGKKNNNQYAMFQVVTDLPNGRYKVRLQAFYYGREVADRSMYLFAKPKHANIKRGAGESVADYTERLKTYFKNNQDVVTDESQFPSWFEGYAMIEHKGSNVTSRTNPCPANATIRDLFNSGEGAIETNVFTITDNTLTIGVRRNYLDTSKGPIALYIDNFQIYYLGPAVEEPTTKSGYYYNVCRGGFMTQQTGLEPTEVSLGPTGKKITATQASGSNWTMQMEGATDWWGNPAASNYLIVDRDYQRGRLWGDGAADNAHRFFNFGTGTGSDAEYLTFKVATTDDTYGTASQFGTTYVGWPADNPQVSPTLHTNDWEPRGDLWSVLNDDQYAAYQPLVEEAFQARHDYWPYMRSTLYNINRLGWTFDISNQKRIWRNPGAAAKDIQKVAQQVRQIILDHVDEATEEKPLDVTYLMGGCNLDSEDFDGKWTQTGFDFNNTYFASTSTDAVTGHSSLGRDMREKWIPAPGTLSGSGELRHQPLRNAMPDGTYSLSVDAVATNQSTREEVTGVTLFATVDGVEVASVPISTLTDEPSKFRTPTFQYSKDKYIDFGIRYEEDTNANWVAVDNFRLLYCGPMHSSEQDKNIEYEYKDTKGTTYDNNILILHGTWRKSEENELNAIIDAMPDITAVVMTTATIKASTPINVHQPGNMLIYVSDAGQVSNTKNVVVGDECSNLVIDDDYAFRGFNAFHASKVSYSRASAVQYNTVCLPFTVAQSQVEDFFGEDAKLYTLESGTEIIDNKLEFKELATGATHPAGIPCIVTKGNDTNSWNIENYEAAFGCSADATNFRAMYETDDPTYVCSQTFLQGSFQRAPLEARKYYKISNGEFVRTSNVSTVWPFRFYMAPKTDSSGEVKPIRFILHSLTDEVTDITSQLDRPQGTWYDLTGRPVGKQPTRPGLYIIEGRKVIVK